PPGHSSRLPVRVARTLSEVRNSTQMLLTLDVHSVVALQELRLALTEGSAGRGEVLARLCLEEGRAPLVRLGRDFDLDGELAERLVHIEGLANVSLTTRRGPSHLRLVA